MAKQSGEVKIAIDMTKGLKSKRLVVTPLEYRIDITFTHSGTADQTKAAELAVNRTVKEALAAERLKFHKHIDKSEKQLLAIHPAPTAETAALAVVDTLNTARLDRLKPLMLRLIQTQAEQVASRILPTDYAVVVKIKRPKKLFELKPAYRRTLSGTAIPDGLKRAKSRFGPLKFDLLAGAPELTWLVLEPPTAIMKVAVDYDVESDGGVEFEALTASLRELVEDYRSQLRKNLPAWDEEVGEALQEKGADEALKIVSQMNGAIQRLAKDGEIEGKRCVDEAFKVLKSRNVAMTVFRVDAGIEVAFSAATFSTAAKEFFTNPPGYNLVAPFIVMVRNANKFAGALRALAGNAAKQHTRVVKSLRKLEENRRLQLKSWEEKSKVEVVSNIKEKVKEAILTEMETCERYINALRVESTKVFKEVQNLGVVARRMTSIQSKLSGDEYRDVVAATAAVIESAETLHNYHLTLESDAEKFSESLEVIMHDATTAVRTGKLLFDLGALLSVLGAVEAGCHLAVQAGEKIANR